MIYDGKTFLTYADAIQFISNFKGIIYNLRLLLYKKLYKNIFKLKIVKKNYYLL